MRVEILDCHRLYDFDGTVSGMNATIRATLDDGSQQQVAYTFTSADLASDDATAVIAREARRLVADMLRQQMTDAQKVQPATDVLAATFDVSDPAAIAITSGAIAVAVPPAIAPMPVVQAPKV